jgi:hypothetical protein
MQLIYTCVCVCLLVNKHVHILYRSHMASRTHIAFWSKGILTLAKSNVFPVAKTILMREIRINLIWSLYCVPMRLNGACTLAFLQLHLALVAVQTQKTIELYIMCAKHSYLRSHSTLHLTHTHLFIATFHFKQSSHSAAFINVYLFVWQVLNIVLRKFAHKCTTEYGVNVNNNNLWSCGVGVSNIICCTSYMLLSISPRHKQLWIGESNAHQRYWHATKYRRRKKKTG